MTNRRRSERYRVELPVRLRDAQGGDDARTADVSSHGISIATAKRRPLRQYVELEITLPAPSPKITATALVARLIDDVDCGTDHGRTGLGLDFFLFDARAKNEWQRFIARVRSDHDERDARDAQPEGLSSLAGAQAGPSTIVPAPAIAPDRLPAAPWSDAEADADTPTFIVKPRDQSRLWAFFRNEMTRGLVRIEAPVAMRPGDPVELLVVHPSTFAEWSLKGRVSRTIARSAVARPVLEIGLTSLSEDDRARFRSFVQTGYGMIQEDVVLTGDLLPEQLPTPVRPREPYFAPGEEPRLEIVDSVDIEIDPPAAPAAVHPSREAAPEATIDRDPRAASALQPSREAAPEATIDLDRRQDHRHASIDVAVKPVAEWLEATTEERESTAPPRPARGPDAVLHAPGASNGATRPASVGTAGVAAGSAAMRAGEPARSEAVAALSVGSEALPAGLANDCVPADVPSEARGAPPEESVRSVASVEERTDPSTRSEAESRACSDPSTRSKAESHARFEAPPPAPSPRPASSARSKPVEREEPQTLSGKLFSSFFFEAAQSRRPSRAIVGQPTAAASSASASPKGGPSIELKSIIPSTQAPAPIRETAGPPPLPDRARLAPDRVEPPPPPPADATPDVEGARAPGPSPNPAAVPQSVRIVRGAPDSGVDARPPAVEAPPPNGHPVRERPASRRDSVVRPSGDEAMSATHRAISTEGSDPSLDRDIAIARARVVRSPNSVTACYRLGTLLLRRAADLEGFGEAITTFERVIELEPNHPGAHHAIAEALMKRGQFSSASEHLQRARRLGYQIDPALERAVAEGKKGL